MLSCVAMIFPPMSFSHPLSCRTCGVTFQSPPRTQGPFTFVSAWATTCRIPRFSSVRPSECFNHTEPTCMPPFHTAPTCASENLCLNCSGTACSVLSSMPMPLRAATMLPPLALFAAVRCASVTVAVHLSLSAAPLTAFTASLPSTLSSCATTTSAAVLGSHVFSVAHELALTVSKAHNPALLHALLPAGVLVALQSFCAALSAASS